MDVMHYTIEQHAYGKVLHYLNFFVTNDVGVPDNMTAQEWAACDEDTATDMVDLRGVYIPVKDVADKLNELDYIEEMATQEMERVVESVAQKRHENYYGNGNPGTYLPMGLVNEDTPCGDYWCYE